MPRNPSSLAGMTFFGQAGEYFELSLNWAERR